MTKSKVDKITVSQLIEYVNNSNTYSEVLKKIGYSQCNQKSTIERLKNRCLENNIDTSSLKELYFYSNKPSSRICTTCGKEKSINDFYQSRGKISYVCKDCTRKKQREKYHKKKEWLDDYKKNCGCKKCGNNKFYLIDFHHIDPTTKQYTISNAPNVKIETLKEELKKCIPLCSNCHREFHYLNQHEGITLEEYLNK